MKIPKRLEPLLKDGLIDDVIMRLRSGKEAEIFIVDAYGDVCCAKVYKEKTKRNFHSQVLYQEGRNRRNSRASRALGKHTKYGRKVEEDEWQHSEVDTLFKLHEAGVTVPVPHICTSGVLLMELVLDADGNAAPQLGDLDFDPDYAHSCHDRLMREVIRMLLAGIVHADLSEYNVVMSYNGPVIIDFPQAVDATANNNAQFFLERDVRNITHFFGRFDSELLKGNYGLEIWQHYVADTLSPNMTLTGQPVISTKEVDIESVFSEIEEAREEAERKQKRLAGIDPDEEESEEMFEWYEPKRKKRTYTPPTRVPSETSPSLPKQKAKGKSSQQNKSKKNSWKKGSKQNSSKQNTKQNASKKSSSGQQSQKQKSSSPNASRQQNSGNQQSSKGNSRPKKGNPNNQNGNQQVNSGQNKKPKQNRSHSKPQSGTKGSVQKSNKWETPSTKVQSEPIKWGR